jgi:hypothetical protein
VITIEYDDFKTEWGTKPNLKARLSAVERDRIFMILNNLSLDDTAILSVVNNLQLYYAEQAKINQLDRSIELATTKGTRDTLSSERYTAVSIGISKLEFIPVEVKQVIKIG